MDRPNEPVYQILNETLKRVEEKIEKEYYEIFLQWPDKREERNELKEKEEQNYKALINVYDSACWVIHDIVYVSDDALSTYLDYRFKALKEAVVELRGKINGDNFTKEEGETIQKIMLKVFKKERILEVAKERDKTIARVIEIERGLINEHSVFSRLYWALREITEEKPE